MDFKEKNNTIVKIAPFYMTIKLHIINHSSKKQVVLINCLNTYIDCKGNFSHKSAYILTILEKTYLF